MKYALKTPDNLSLFRYPNGSIPPFEDTEKTPNLDTAALWPVDESVADGKRWTGAWELVDGTVRKVVVDAPVITPPAPVMPWAISNADLRRGLVGRGINPALITGYLNSLEEGAPKWAALADWEYANYFERAHPMLNQLAPAFGLTVDDVDQIFWAYPAYPRPFAS